MASSAWMAGSHADDAFIVSMVALTCIIAAIADWPVATATVVLQLGGFAIVQFHQQSVALPPDQRPASAGGSRRS
jgi:hypothetical protein